jgi:hypothetical protein
MLTYFPSYFSRRAIICYLVTLALVSALFMSYVLPFQFMLFGLVPVIVFFNYSNKLTMSWQRIKPATFTKKLFKTALIIRIVYVIFIYFYYIKMTGLPHMYYPGDELLYEEVGLLLKDVGPSRFAELLRAYNISFSDSGYCWWLAFENFILGTHPLSYRTVKCVVDAFSCVLIYNLAKRNFGEATGRIAGIFCMLIPNLWYYCGLTLKETEMTFLTILFVERADFALRSKKITISGLAFPALIVLLMFTFRTALGAVLVAALVAALILTSGRQLEVWKKIILSLIFGVWMMMTVGVEIIQETQELWEGRHVNQSVGYGWRAETNSFAKYASASVFAPLIFTIPFSSMVTTPGQENQMMMNGANFIKNIMSGLTILAMFLLLVRGDWRKHVLPIAVMMGYLVVLVFSNFAHSERFHLPVVPLEYMFAAYGVSQLTNKHKRWYVIWLVGISVANIAWAYVKLVGRGFSV